MIILGLVVLIGAVLTALWIANDPYEWGFTIFGGAISTFVALLAVGALMQVPVHIFTDHAETDEFQGSFGVIAAADSSLTNGSFFIFGGQINEEPVYFYYRQGTDGAITQGHVPVNDTVIYEDQETTGHIEIYRDEDVTTLWYFYSGANDTRYEIHVPKGSVMRQFNFDLEK